MQRKKKPFNLFCYVYSMYKCKYDHIGFKTFACMYTVASLEECIEKNLLFKVVITCCMKSAWGTLCICALAKKKMS